MKETVSHDSSGTLMMAWSFTNEIVLLDLVTRILRDWCM